MKWLSVLHTACVVLALAGNASTRAHAQAPPAIRLADFTRQAALDFRHFDGSSGSHYLVEVVAAGMATFDYDLDGRIDLYFLNGAELEGTVYNPKPRNALYRNLAHFEFSNATHASRLGDAGFGMGVTVGDYDNDGFADVYISNFGPNRLYHNQGDGTFVVVDIIDPRPANTAGGGCSMLDIEGDGDLDIYTSNYIQFGYDVPVGDFRGRKVYGGPLLYPKAPDLLLRNDGQGGFSDFSNEAGIARVLEWGMGTVCFDIEPDGDTDIFVANDSTRNSLFQNDGTGHFADIALESGVAYDHRGDPQGSMGVDVADFNGDLTLDIFQTAYTKQLATLYENLGFGLFQDSTLRTSVGVGTFYPVNWGTGFVDLDNDGDKDLFIANGHIHDNMDDLDDTISYKIANQVMENLNGQRFRDVSLECGSGLVPKESSRGIAIDDLDLDGRPDIVVLNSRTAATVLRNESLSKNNWIEFDLVGVTCNRDAVGTRVVIRCGAVSQVLEVHSGRGYQSHFGSRLHFGLGTAQVIDQLEVYWHSGKQEVYRSLQANGLYLLRQGADPMRHEAQP